MENLLDEPSRLGFIYVPGSEQPAGIGQLVLTDNAITLEVPLHDLVGECQKWFRDRRIPRSILFVDGSNRIALSDCRFRQHVDQSHGKGRIVASSAVVAPRTASDFSTVNGVRSEVMGLAAWTGLPAVTAAKRGFDEKGLIKSASFSAESSPKVVIDAGIQLSLFPHFRTNSLLSNGVHTITEKVFIQTYTAELSDWNHHLRAHQLVQDLMTVVYWSPCALAVEAVSRDDAPILDPIEKYPLGQQWNTSRTVWRGRGNARTPKAIPERHKVLFTFDDIGAKGVKRWIEEGDRWKEIVGPLISSRYQPDATIEVVVFQIAIAMESLGHLIAVRNGEIESTGSLQFPQYMQRIQDDLDCSTDQVLAGDEDYDVPAFASFKAWARAFNEVYKGVKHADNEKQELGRSWVLVESAMLWLRLWIAREFGVSREVLEANTRYH